MSRKMTPFDRRKMLEARDEGLTDDQIKARFSITDNRTLRRHLKLAEQEQDSRLVKVDILKDALAGHLAEIRSLIERWQGILRTPQVDEGYRGIYSPSRSLEADSLFNSLREHLPVPILWRNYTIWKKSLDEYVNIWKMLIEEIKQLARSWQNVRRIRDDFQQPVLKRLSYKALERKLEPFRFEKRESGDYEILLVDGVETLETSDALAYEQQYKRLCDQVLGSELATNLINRYRELRAQEPKIRESLQEILQRRDYIMYSCKLCPGQPKL